MYDCDFDLLDEILDEVKTHSGVHERSGGIPLRRADDQPDDQPDHRPDDQAWRSFDSIFHRDSMALLNSISDLICSDSKIQFTTIERTIFLAEDLLTPPIRLPNPETFCTASLVCLYATLLTEREPLSAAADSFGQSGSSHDVPL